MKLITWLIIALLLAVTTFWIMQFSEKDKTTQFLNDSINKINNLKGYNSLEEISQTSATYDGTYKIEKSDDFTGLFDISFEKLSRGENNLLNTSICFNLGNVNKTDILDKLNKSDVNITNKIHLKKNSEDAIPQDIDLIATNLKGDKIVPIDDIITKKVNIYFCYEANPNTDYWLKFGDNSTVIVQNIIYTSLSYQANTTSEQNNITHLSIDKTKSPYTNLVAYWNFDKDITNRTAYDFSSNHYDLTYSNGAIINETSCLYDNCTSLDGINDDLEITPASPSPLKNLTGNVTISAWFNTRYNGTAQAQTIYFTGTSMGYAIRTEPTNNLGWYSHGGGINITSCAVAGYSNPTNTWRYGTFTANDTTLAVFLDGVMVKNCSGILYVNGTGTNTKYIGSTASRYWNGSLDEIMLFNISLNSSQILDIYRNQSVRYYPVGTQSTNNTINVTIGYNMLNISLNSLENNFGTNISLAVSYYNGTWQITKYQNITAINTNYTYNVTYGTTNITLNWTLISGAYNFYSPILNGNTIIEQWNVSQAQVQDNTYPTFSTYWNNNASLSGSGIALFNVTLANTNGTVFIQINNTNYTAKNITASVYNVSLNLANGTYGYYWGSWGNGTAKNYNVSNTQYYTVNISIDTEEPIFSTYAVSLTNNSEYNLARNYQFNTTITSTNGTAGFQINNINYSMSNVSNVFNRSITPLGAGTLLYYFWAWGNGTSHNYNISNTQYYTIAKNTTSSLGATATSPITYGTSTDFTGSNCPTELSCSFNISNQVYRAGTISANYSTSGNNNYSSSSTISTVTINKDNGLIRTYINNTEGNFNSTNGTNILLNGTLITGIGNIELWLNGSIINSGASPRNNLTNLSNGYYNFTAFYNGNENYTSDDEYWFINISLVTATDTKPPYFTTIPNPTIITYGQGFGVQFNATDETAFGTYLINRTDIFNINNSGFLKNTSLLGSANYYINVSINDSSGNTNYTIYNVTITKANAVINTYLNGSRANKGFTNTTEINITAYLITGVGNLNITNNSVQLKTGASPLLYTDNWTVGTWIINASVLSSQNYTPASEKWTLTITAPSTSSNVTSITTSIVQCKYKKFGYYNINLPFFRELNCI